VAARCGNLESSPVSPTILPQEKQITYLWNTVCRIRFAASVLAATLLAPR